MKAFIVTIYHAQGQPVQYTGQFASTWAALDAGFALVQQVEDRITARPA